MPATAETTALTGTEMARWLLPLLKEYTDKLNAACDSLFALERQGYLTPSGMPIRTNSALAQLGILLPRCRVVASSLKTFASQGSALLDHYDFEEEELRTELLTRWSEADASIRAAEATTAHVHKQFGAEGHAERLKSLTAQYE